MAQTSFTDALYSTPDLLNLPASAVPGTYFTLSATGSNPISAQVVLLSSGDFFGFPTVGVAYNSFDWTDNSIVNLSARRIPVPQRVTITPFVSGANTMLSNAYSATDAVLVLSVSLSAANGLPVGILLKNRWSTVISLSSGTNSYAVDLSAFNTVGTTPYNVSDKNWRRLKLLELA